MVQQTAAPLRTEARTPALGSVALTLLMVAILGLVVAVTLVPRLVGAVPLAVPSQSMQPALAQGDLVMVRPVEPELLMVGDVVAFYTEGGPIGVLMHRVVDVIQEHGEVVAVQTQGDANPYPDHPITSDRLKGRVAYSIPFVGPVAQRPALIAGVTVGGLALVGVTAMVLIAPGAPTMRDGLRRLAGRRGEWAS